MIVHASNQFHIGQAIGFAEGDGVIVIGEGPCHVDASGFTAVSFNEHAGVRVAQGSYHIEELWGKRCAKHQNVPTRKAQMYSQRTVSVSKHFAVTAGDYPLHEEKRQAETAWRPMGGGLFLLLRGPKRCDIYRMRNGPTPVAGCLLRKGQRWNMPDQQMRIYQVGVHLVEFRLFKLDVGTPRNRPGPSRLETVESVQNYLQKNQAVLGNE